MWNPAFVTKKKKTSKNDERFLIKYPGNDHGHGTGAYILVIGSGGTLTIDPSKIKAPF